MHAPRLVGWSLVLALLAACGGRPAPLDRRDGGASARDAAPRDGGRPGDALVIHGDAGPVCDDLAERYFEVAASLSYCQADSDCIARGEDCSIGAYAGRLECYLYVNRESNPTELADLVLAWQQQGCPLAGCLPCPTPPALACQGGRCVLRGTGCGSGGCESGPGLCCDRDCDPATDQLCNMLCPPVSPPDPLCDCRDDACVEVQCDASGFCPPGSQCGDGGRCIRDQRCDEPSVGCKPFLDHCSCEWRCVEGDAVVADCPTICPDEDQLSLFPPVCRCGEGGCGMQPCTAQDECGFGMLCEQVPGSQGYPVCTECAVCDAAP